MKFSLNTTIIKPDNNEEIKHAIILLHGYGEMVKISVCLPQLEKIFKKYRIFVQMHRKDVK